MPDTFISILLFFAAGAIVLFLPGAAWLRWDRSGRGDALEWIGEAAGLSIALTALAAALFFWAGIRLSAAGLVALYVLALAVWLAGQWRAGLDLKKWSVSAPALAAAAFALGLVAWRVYQARDLATPAWVDPVQHALLVRKIIDYGGLPPNWMPYLPVPEYYHFGFHTIAASFSVWSGLGLAQAMLPFGQVLNALVAVAVYRLGKVLWDDWRRAGLAALLVEFAFTMPAYYVTWGRYPLLTGLALMALAMAAALELRNGKHSWWAAARLAIYTAGVCFTHYLATALLGVFFLLLALAEAWKWIKIRRIASLSWQPLAAGAAGCLLALPWLLRVWSYTHHYAAVILGDPFDPSRTQTIQDTLNYVLYLVGPLRGYVLLALAGIGLILAFLRPRLRLLAVWSLVLAFEATPYAPQFSPFRPDLLAIVLFLPASLLVVELLSSLNAWLGSIRFKYARPVSVYLPFLLALALLAWGAVETRNIINPVTVLTSPADLVALDWIEKNTPATARFFINSVPWQNKIYRGVDGGCWIMPETGRFTIVPPVAIAMGSAEDMALYEGWAQRASGITGCDENFWSLVNETNLDYIYLKQGTGSLKPAALAKCGGITQVYDRDGVFIHQISKNP